MGFNIKDLPQPFGPYVLKQKFAGGGMAEIYLAEATGPGGFIKPLVIKTIHQAYIDDKRFVSMFIEEAKILSSLTHGNIVPIFDFGTANNLLYLAMELIDGVDTATLMDVCRTQGIVIPIDVALYIGVGTAAGLSHAHQAKDAHGKSLGIVHRDISPHNILLSRSGEVKLCDFGLATRSLEDISANVATNDEIKGKLRYLSPEQAGGGAVDKRSDLFSLGVVLYELIAGHHPVPSGAGVSVLRELAGGSGYPSLYKVAPWIQKDICDIIDRALYFDKEKRFQNAEEMRAALSTCLHRDFPELSPEKLAALVIRIQTAAESAESDDEVSMARARLASFASSSRSKTASDPSLHSLPLIKRRPLVLVAGLIAAAAVIGWYFIESYIHREVPSNPQNIGLSHAAPPVSTPTPPGISKRQDTEKETENKNTDTSSLGTDVEIAQLPAAASDSASAAQQKADLPGNKDAAFKKFRSVGIVNINASPWAVVEIDGNNYTTTPLLGIKLRAGKHKAVLRNSELGITKTRVFTVKPNEAITILVEMEPGSAGAGE